MLLTFELNKDQIEIIFNSEGYKALLKAIEEVKPTEEENNPNLYQIEDRSNNRSRKFEKKDE